MKRLMALVCMLLMAWPALADEVFPLAAEERPETIVDAPLPEDPFLQHVVELARRIDVLAENDLFMGYNDDYYSGNATDEQLEKVSRGAHTMPARIFHVGGDALIDALYSGAPEGYIPLDFTRMELRRDLVDNLPQMVLGVRENTELHLIYMLARVKVFAADVPDDCGVFILLYDDATPVMLPWYSANGVVSISAWFIPDNVLEDCRTADEVSAWFAGKGMPAVQFEEVQP